VNPQQEKPRVHRMRVRGGSRNDGDPSGLRGAVRSGHAPSRRYMHIGFRPVLDLQAAPKKD